jgi:hypothetical protein
MTLVPTAATIRSNNDPGSCCLASSKEKSDSQTDMDGPIRRSSRSSVSEEHLTNIRNRVTETTREHQKKNFETGYRN